MLTETPELAADGQPYRLITLRNANGVVVTLMDWGATLLSARIPLSDGSVREAYKDKLYISTSNKMKPQVVGPKKHNGKFVTITEDGRGMVDGVDVTDQLGWEVKVPYRGCYCNIKVQFVAGKSFKGGNGEIIPNQVYAKIEAVQFAQDGEAFGSGPTSADGFDEEEVAETTSGANDLF